MQTDAKPQYFGQGPKPTEPTAVQPPESLILAAMRSLPYLVAKWAPRGNLYEPVHIFEYILTNGGFNSSDPNHKHTEAAAQWAIHRFVLNGMLSEKPGPSHCASQTFLEPTENLWEWWRRQTDATAGATHSEDFRSALWFGVPHSFTPNQAACVRVLWEAWERKTPDVGGETLLQTADASTARVDVVFRGNPAWGTMIIKGGTKGSYRLVEPPADCSK